MTTPYHLTNCMGTTMQVEKKAERFNKVQAQAKLGQKVQLIIDLPEIPLGTKGCVMEMDEIEQAGFELIIEWNLRVGGKLQHDWFTREEYEQAFIEI